MPAPDPTFARLIGADTRPGRDPRGRGRRRRLADPQTYLKLVMAGATIALLILPLAGNGVTAALTPRTPDGCRVVSVIDGDTVRLWCPARGLESARLMGYDTPEKFSPRCGVEYARAVAAIWQLRRLLVGAREVSVVREGTDRYGRALVRVRVDGESVARRMIALGNARAYGGGHRAGWCT